MFCNQCGKPIPDDAMFCQHCGCEVGIKEDKAEKPAKEKRQKPIATGGKKKWIIFVVAAVAVIAIIAGGVMAMSKQEVLAELPDPEHYFPVVAEVELSDDCKRVVIRSDENLWEQAAGYVNLLKWSGKYPLTQSHEERFANGDYSWQFVYNNKEDIKEPYFCQVEVNYYYKSDATDHFAIWVLIHDIDAFDLVQKEIYEAPAATDTAQSTDNAGTTDMATDTSDKDNSGSSVSDFDAGDFVTDDDDDDSFEVPDSSGLYDNPTPCGVCNRSGDCGTCGGDGYLMSSASDEEDRNCYACSGSGNCRSCGGDGEL